MLVRRIGTHVKEQNWFAAGLGVAIIFVGVFILLRGTGIVGAEAARAHGVLATSTASAAKVEYVMNFDLIFKTHDDEIVYSHQLQGINCQDGMPFHGRDLGEIDYFLTVTESDDGRGKLTIEFYQFETRRKESDVLAELVEEVGFDFGSPVTFESSNDNFSVDLAFSVIQK